MSENSNIALFTIGPYVHSYKFKICIHNSLQNNGMVLFVVKILAAGVWRAFDTDMLSIYTFNTIWKIPASIEVFDNFLKYFFCWKSVCCACRAVHMAQVVTLIVDAMAHLLIHIENESCLKEIPVERCLQ